MQKRSLGGRDVCLFKDKINIRYTGSKGYAPHQDAAAGWDDFAERFVSIGLFLHPSDPSRGGFEIASNVHRRGRFSNEKGRMDEEEFQALCPETLRANTGDAIFLDSEVPHKTLCNKSVDHSYHLIFTFALETKRDIRNAYYKEKERSFSNSRNENCYEFRVFEF